MPNMACVLCHNSITVPDDFNGEYNRYNVIEEEEEEELYLTPNRQMYNASHIIYKIRAIYTHAHMWTHVH